MRALIAQANVRSRSPARTLDAAEDLEVGDYHEAFLLNGLGDQYGSWLSNLCSS
jgi:hypothetical protein